MALTMLGKKWLADACLFTRSSLASMRPRISPQRLTFDEKYLANADISTRTRFARLTSTPTSSHAFSVSDLYKGTIPNISPCLVAEPAFSIVMTKEFARRVTDYSDICHQDTISTVPEKKPQNREFDLICCHTARFSCVYHTGDSSH
jgi:hypothetical protein